jgi:hypothetical protein
MYCGAGCCWARWPCMCCVLVVCLQSMHSIVCGPLARACDVAHAACFPCGQAWLVLRALMFFLLLAVTLPKPQPGQAWHIVCECSPPSRLCVRAVFGWTN